MSVPMLLTVSVGNSAVIISTERRNRKYLVRSQRSPLGLRPSLGQQLPHEELLILPRQLTIALYGTERDHAAALLR